MTDEELTQKIVKAICDLKKSKLIFHKISDRINNMVSDNSPEEEYTVIGVRELEKLKRIEKDFFDIGELSKKMYEYLKREK